MSKPTHTQTSSPVDTQGTNLTEPCLRSVPVMHSLPFLGPYFLKKKQKLVRTRLIECMVVTGRLENASLFPAQMEKLERLTSVTKPFLGSSL